MRGLVVNWNVSHTPTGRSRGGLLQNFQNVSPTFEKRLYEYWREVVKACYSANVLDGAVLILSAPCKTFVLPGNENGCTTDQDSKQMNLVLCWSLPRNTKKLYILIDNLNCNLPVRARFSAPVHTGPGAHSDSYTMDTGSFPGVKRPGRGPDHPPLSGVEVQYRVALYLYSPIGPSRPVLCWTLPLPLYCNICIFFVKTYFQI
jgi:hypothetical protein